MDDVRENTEKEREDVQQAINDVAQEIDRREALKLAMRRFALAKRKGYLH